MHFGEKIRALRTERKWSQSETAEKIGVSLRTYQNYEACKMHPKQTALYGKISELFAVSTDYLLHDEITQPNPPADAPEDPISGVDALIRTADALFAGGELSEDDKEKVILALNELYWRAKAKNQERGR